MVEPHPQSPPSAVVLKLNVVLYRVKIQYLLTTFDNVSLVGYKLKKPSGSGDENGQSAELF